ncbi:hypothetical protein GCM10010862_21830 [Devosia nitrariae]|uniref:Uncharacterized protein n=1 Tax=Devosia nitrariae TaxID=2071872 RepID=A0ABQ5W4C7_9HYPH|nr:hypothetical protein GCM10010862_21830 [Devosia nitrariae]
MHRVGNDAVGAEKLSQSGDDCGGIGEHDGTIAGGCKSARRKLAPLAPLCHNRPDHTSKG